MRVTGVGTVPLATKNQGSLPPDTADFLFWGALNKRGHLKNEITKNTHTQAKKELYVSLLS